MNKYEFNREIPVEEEYDMLVVGGGPAGSAAAICAARLGAKVLLAEACGCLGGMATSGLVTAFDGMADGQRSLVGGIMREIVETLYERGNLPQYVKPENWRQKLLCPTRFHPEPLKRLLDELALQAGVEVRFFTRLIAVDADPAAGNVRGAILSQVDGLRYVAARAFIDATGDAEFAAQAGAKYRQAGHDTEHIMPASLCWLGAGIDWANIKDTKEAIKAAVAKGLFPMPDFRSVLSAMDSGQGGFNAGHLYEVNNLDSARLSAAMREGRKIAHTYNEFYRKNVPGFENMQVAATAGLLGVRESRRIVGEYELTFDDFKARRKFPDQIGLFNKEVDIHAYGADREQQEKAKAFRASKDGWLNKGESYGIPYGVIVPCGWRNLWVPGRAASCDVIVHGSLRVMPACAMMGQAAGTAAVLAARSGASAAKIDTAELAGTLRSAGAILS